MATPVTFEGPPKSHADKRLVDLGIDDSGDRGLPPLAFEDLWYALDVTKRASLLEYMAQDTVVSAANLASSLTSLDHQDGTFLVGLLVECSMFRFRLYIRICSIDRCFAFDNQPFSENAITTNALEHLPEWREDIKDTLDTHWNMESSEASTEDALDQAEQPPEDPVEDVASSSLTAFEPADPKIRQFIQDLPSELLLLIQNNLLHLAFGPRRIYPHNEHMNIHVFEALDHQLLAKYQHLFFCDNIWVIGQGDYDDCAAFLDHMPTALHDSIRKVELSFTTDDHIYPSLDSYFAEDAQDIRNVLEVLQSYRHVLENDASLPHSVGTSKH